MQSQLIWIGDVTRQEFATAWHELSGSVQCEQFDHLAQVTAQSTAPLVVLAQPSPGVTSPPEVITDLQADRMDAAFVYLLGDWCCGEKRVNGEFSRIPSLYAHQLQPGRVHEHLLSVARKDFAPPLAGQTETLVAIYTTGNSYAEAIADLLSPQYPKSIQLSLADQTPAHGVDLVIWEAPAEKAHRNEELQRLRARHPQAQVLALLTFPRSYEREFFADQGVRVVAQPFVQPELMHAIDLSWHSRQDHPPIRLIA